MSDTSPTNAGRVAAQPPRPKVERPASSNERSVSAAAKAAPNEPRAPQDRSAPKEDLAILAAIEDKRPPLAVCGHIHESWGERSSLGPTAIANLGPAGATFEI